MSTTTFMASVESFKDASPWLGPEHDPALVTLVAIAETLDGGDRTPALLAQWGLTYRSLLKLAPRAAEGTGDPLEEALPS